MGYTCKCQIAVKSTYDTMLEALYRWTSSSDQIWGNFNRQIISTHDTICENPKSGSDEGDTK